MKKKIIKKIDDPKNPFYADESWRDNEDTQKYLPKSEEAIKWLKTVWDKQEKANRAIEAGLKKSKDAKKRLEEWYAKNNVKIGI